MLAILYCPECKKMIESMGAPVYEMYMSITENYFVYRIHCYMYSNTTEGRRSRQILRYMEMKGLIVSTDIENDIIAIKPNGITCFDGKDGCLCHVCLKPKEHAEMKKGDAS